MLSLLLHSKLFHEYFHAEKKAYPFVTKPCQKKGEGGGGEREEEKEKENKLISIQGTKYKG